MVVQVADIVGKGEVKQHSDRVDVDLPSVLLIPILFHLVKGEIWKEEKNSLSDLGEASSKVHGPDVEGGHDDLFVGQHGLRLLGSFR